MEYAHGGRHFTDGSSCPRCLDPFTAEKPPLSPLPDGCRYHAGPCDLVEIEVMVPPTSAKLVVVREETLPASPPSVKCPTCGTWNADTGPDETLGRCWKCLNIVPALEGIPDTSALESARAAGLPAPASPAPPRRGDGHACDFQEIPALGVLACGLCTRRACVLCGCERWECPHERYMRIRLVTIDVTEVQAVALSPLARILRVVPMDFGGLGAAALVVVAPDEGVLETRTIRMLQVAGADQLPNPARQRYVGMVALRSNTAHDLLGVDQSDDGGGTSPGVAYFHVFEELREGEKP